MPQPHSSQSIPVNTVLGERYKVTGSVIETAAGDSVLEGKDQVLNRKVSIVVAAQQHNDRLMSNARTLVSQSRANIQVLDLGNTANRTYLITSHSRADMLLDTLLADAGDLAENSETQEALGQEIFGDEQPATNQTAYVSQGPAKPQSISATREVNESDYATPAAAAPAAASVTASSAPVEEPYENDYAEYDDYDDYTDDDYEEDERRGSGGIWAVAIAAILLLVVGVAIAFSLLNGMVHNDPDEQKAAPASSSSKASTSATPSPSATSSSAAAKPAPKFDGVTRLVPSNPTFMADQDGTLNQMTDGNSSTAWMSYGFATANFGGATDALGLAYQLEEQTTVSKLTIEQNGGTGGAFTVLTNDSASLDGAQEVGSGSFNGSTVTVDLDTAKQGDGVKYVIIRFTEAPSQAQPIAGYNYGLRISEVTASN